ncbi:hypothetical protein Efla_000771 [Eimeria flavescens]
MPEPWRLAPLVQASLATPAPDRQVTFQVTPHASPPPPPIRLVDFSEMSKQVTFKAIFKLLTVFTGILFVRQVAAGPHTRTEGSSSPAIAAAQAAAAAAAEAAAAAARAAAAAAAAIASGGPLPEGSTDQGTPLTEQRQTRFETQDQQPVSSSLLSPAAAAPTAASSSSASFLKLARAGGPRAIEELQPPGDPTSPATPPGVAAAVDSSAEDSSTFEPRLYLPPRRPPLDERRRKQWLSEEAQYDVLLQQLMEQTAAQAWNAYRRHRFDPLTEPAATEFLVTGRRQQPSETAN